MIPDRIAAGIFFGREQAMSDVNNIDNPDIADESENENLNGQQELDDLTVLSNVGNQDMGQARLNQVRQTDVSDGALGSLATIHHGSGNGIATQQGFETETGQLGADQLMLAEGQTNVAPVEIATQAAQIAEAEAPSAVPASQPAPQTQTAAAPAAPAPEAPADLTQAPTEPAAAPAAPMVGAGFPAEAVSEAPMVAETTVPPAPEQPVHIDQLPVFGGVTIDVGGSGGSGGSGGTGGNGANPNAGGPYDMQGQEGQDLRFHVNAYDPDGGAVSIDFSAGEHGVIRYDSATGEYVYHPTDENWWGDDKITVFVRDDEGNLVTRDITIGYSNVDDEAVATIDGGRGDESTTDGATVVTGTINATDIDGTIVGYEVVDDGTAHHGSLSVDAHGNFVFTAPDHNWNGSDSFTVRLTDQYGGTTEIQVPVTVNPTDDAAQITSPATVDLTVGQDGVATGDLDAMDPDGDPLTYGIVDPHTGNLVNRLDTEYGTVTINPNDGTYSFTPNDKARTLDDGEHATDTFQVAVTDGHTISSPQTVGVTIDGANDEPVIKTVATNLATNEDGPATGTVAATDVDAHDTVSYTLVTTDGRHVTEMDTQYGHVEIDPTTGQYTFTPKDGLQALDDNDVVTDGFQVAAYDGTAYSDPRGVSVTISGSNDAPVVETVAANLTTDEDGSATGSIAATDADAHDTVSYTLVTAGGQHVTEMDTRYGHVEINPTTGQYTFTPKDGLQALDDNESVQDGFQVAAYDGTAYSDPRDVSVTISGSNDAPVVSVSDLSAGEDQTVSATATFTDVDVEQSSFFLLNDKGERVTELTTDYGTVRIDSATGTYTFVPGDAADALKAGQIAHDDFKVVAYDGTAQSAPQVVDVTLTGTNDAPVVSVADLATDENSAVTGTATFTDADNSSTSYYLLNGKGERVTEVTTDHGTVTIDTATGEYTFTPSAAADTLKDGQAPVDSFQVVAFDGQAQSAPQTVDVTITGTDDATVITGTVDLGSMQEDGGTITFTANQLLANAGDVDNALHVANVKVDGGTLADDGHGNYTFTPGADFSGTVHVSYDVVTDQGVVSRDSAVIEVTADADAPELSASATVSTGSSSVTLDVDATVGAGTVHYKTEGDTTVGNGDGTLVMRVAQLTGGNKGQAASFTVSVVDADGTVTVIGHGQANGSSWQNVTIDLDDGFSGFKAGQTLQVSGDRGTNVSIDKLVVNGVEIQAESGVKDRGANFHTGNGSDGGYASLHDGSVNFGLHGEGTHQTPVSESHSLTISVNGQESALGGVTLGGLPAGAIVTYTDAGNHTVSLKVGNDGSLPLSATEALRIADVGATLTTAPGVPVGTVTTQFDMVGTGASDALVGGDANDHIRGGAGDDVIHGDAAVEAARVDLDILATDHDASETVSYTIHGVPAGMELANDTGNLTRNSDGTYTLEGDDLHNLHIVVPAGSPDAKFQLVVDATSHDGGDTATVSKTLNIDATVSTGAGAGNDTLEGGAGNDTIYGGGGNDTLIGGAGADLLEGGAGNDTFALTGEDGNWSSGYVAQNVGDPTAGGTNETASITGDKVTADIIHGGEGTDTLTGSAGNDAIFLDDSYTAAAQAGARIDGVEVINAGAGDDVVDLTSTHYTYGDVTVDGGAGNDVVWGNAGNDVLAGGDGNDNLFGGSGRDTLSGGDGSDVLNGGAGADVIDAGTGNDTVIAKGGEMAGDAMQGGAGTDVLNIQLSAAEYTNAVRAELLAFKDYMTAHPDGTFTFTTLGGATASGFESVKVSVGGSEISLNRPPSVEDIKASVAESSTDAPTTVTGSLGATDADRDALTYEVVNDGTAHNGTFTVDAQGNYTFVANDANWNGTETFSVRVSDGHGGTVTQTVTVEVTPTNDGPVATDDSGVDASAQAPSLSVDISDAAIVSTANTHDFSVGNLSSGATTATGGSGNADHVAVDNLNSPINLQGGDDTLVVGNQNGGASIDMGTGNDRVQVSNANAAIALGEGDNKLVVGNQNGSAAVTAGSGNDSVQITGGANAAIALGDGNNQISVGSTLNSGANITTGGGNDYVTIAGDGNAGISTGAGDDVIKVGGGVQANQNVLDAGAGNDVVTVGGYVSSTINGGEGADTVVLSGYTQQMWNSNTNQIQSYITNFENVVVSDGHGGLVAVKGDASALNIADSTSAYTYTVKVDAGLNDTDGSESLSSATLANIPDDAKVSLGGQELTRNADGTYTVPLNASGDATLKVTGSHALDLSGVKTSVTATETNGGGAVTTTVTGEGSNPGQTTGSDTIATAEDHSLTLKASSLLANDSDVDGDTLSITGVGGASHGTVSLDADGNVVFTPEANYSGTATFQYTVSDGHGGTDTATVTLQVSPENDAPVVTRITGGVGDESTTTEATQVSGRIIATDVDGDTLSYSVVADNKPHNGELTVGTDGTFTFAAKDADWHGTDTFTVRISDGHGGTVDTQVTVTVNDTRDAPTLTVDLGGTVVAVDTDRNYDDTAGRPDDSSLFQLNDTFYGTAGNDTLSGQGIGSDTLFGAAGNDTLKGADGDDVIYGGSGNDVIKGNSWAGGVDNDTLYGGSGNDTVDGGLGYDKLYGGTGNDVLTDTSPDFNTTMVGGAGSDTLTSGGSDDVLYGDDVSSGYVNVDLTIAATDADSSDRYVVTGLPAGVDLVAGNGSPIAANADGSFTLSESQLAGLHLRVPADLSLDSVSVQVALVDGNGAVLASGTDTTIIDAALVAGNDTLSGGDGRDTLYGGGGDDTLIYNADKVDGWFDADYADQGGAAHDGTGAVVDSSGYNDTNDTFFGGSGHDTLVMTGGDDAIHISHLNSVEVINAGAGDDVVDLNYTDGSTYGDVTVDGGAGNDVIFANDGNDTLIGGTGNDFLSGDAGNDVLRGGAGADTLIGGAGIDTVDYSDSASGVSVYLGAGDGHGYGGAGGYGQGGDAQGDVYSGVENVVGSSHDDYVYGSASGSTVSLGAGNDTFDNTENPSVVVSDSVDGGAGNDTIWTGLGNDTLDGGAGNDVLVGEVGNDVMNGGDGSDTFLFDFGDGHDVVNGGVGRGANGEDWTDTLDISSMGAGVKFTVTMDDGTSWTATTDDTDHITKLGDDASGKVVIQHSDNSTDTIDFHSLEQIKW
jgi:VCBS repeat-containing protein